MKQVERKSRQRRSNLSGMRPVRIAEGYPTPIIFSFLPVKL